VGELFIERDEMSNIDVAIVLFEENILADLVSAELSVAVAVSSRLDRDLPVDEGVVESKLEKKLFQLGLDLATSIFSGVVIWRQHAQRVYRLTIHLEFCLFGWYRLVVRGGVEESGELRKYEAGQLRRVQEKGRV
jgi:hypothetical protein